MSERTAARLGSSDRTQDLPVLIAQTGKLNGSRWVLEGAQTLIGRGAECELVIPDRQVSRTHARIVHSPEGYYLEDLGSKNGTHVNGAAVEGRVLLQDGDIIQGAVAMKLVFVGTESTIPLNPPRPPPPCPGPAANAPAGSASVGRSGVAGSAALAAAVPHAGSDVSQPRPGRGPGGDRGAGLAGRAGLGRVRAGEDP